MTDPRAEKWLGAAYEIYQENAACSDEKCQACYDAATEIIAAYLRAAEADGVVLVKVPKVIPLEPGDSAEDCQWADGYNAAIAAMLANKAEIG